ncbi:ribosome-associated translation inhibitor RaiA, partial [Patescibacteria group bacterium]|nr:ribosome-associated translation inhibitor RaiA [Patescibacteria group bacterium]
FTIHEKNLKLSDFQKDYVLEKVDHLKTYGERVDDESTQVRIDIQTNKLKTTNKNYTVQVTMYVPHAVVRAEVFSQTIEEGIDVAVEKLKKQIERYKSRKNRRDVSGKWIPASTLEEISATAVAAESQNVPEAVSTFSKRKTFTLTPMHEEEAIEQLELLGHSFYAFLNEETERFNIAYMRDDDTYGLLDFGLDRS